MFRAALALGLIALVGLSAPARAADVETLGCIEQGLDEKARALLSEDLEKNLNNAAGEQSYRPETITAMQDVAKACQAKHSWSAASTKAAVLYTLPTLGWPIGERLAREQGLSPEALTVRFRALPDAERLDAINDTVLGKLARGGVDAGEITESTAPLAGALFALLGLREKALADFAST